MKRLVLLAFFALSANASHAAATSPEAAAATLWRSLSHPPGVAADVGALSELFHADGVVIGARYRADIPTLSIAKGADFIAGMRQARPTGFHECEVAREVLQYDRFATVYSVVESRTDPGTKADFVGVNSIQLYRGDHGWKIVSLYYQVEKPGLPVPLRGGRTGVCLTDKTD